MTNPKTLTHLANCLHYLLDYVTLTALHGRFNCLHKLPLQCTFGQLDVSFGNVFNFAIIGLMACDINVWL